MKHNHGRILLGQGRYDIIKILRNDGSLSARKRSAHFDFLTDEELVAMQQAVKDGYNQPPGVAK